MFATIEPRGKTHQHAEGAAKKEGPGRKDQTVKDLEQEMDAATDTDMLEKAKKVQHGLLFCSTGT